MSLPYSYRVLLENARRNNDATSMDVIVRRDVGAELRVYPTRVLMQDTSGLPALVDLAAMRDVCVCEGVDPALIDLRIPVDFVNDHSVAVDASGTPEAFEQNLSIDYERNAERYRFLKWCTRAFRGLRLLPPGRGICHQINLEVLATVVTTTTDASGETVVEPEIVVGTDSHTPMINGLGVLAWGVGGIEAESVMLGNPQTMGLPPVVAVELAGTPRPSTMATDIVLALTATLRESDLVGCMVEFIGAGAAQLDVADRATIANMAPEYGATTGYFPIDARVIEYLRATARPESLVTLVERYARDTDLWHGSESAAPEYDRVITFDLAAVLPTVAGPRYPHQRLTLDAVPTTIATSPSSRVEGRHRNGDLAIAAITSCTNTSHPGSMIAAGLLARNAVRLGLRVPSYVKTSMAPGSPVVTSYLFDAGLTESLDELGFQTVAFGCTTCMGNSGPLKDEVEIALREEEVTFAAVLSGNRNFTGRVHPQLPLNFLASPALVVAYAIAGTMAIDLSAEPLGTDQTGRPVMLDALWPSAEEIARVSARFVTPALFARHGVDLTAADSRWDAIETLETPTYPWHPSSTHLHPSPLALANRAVDLVGARVLLKLGDGITTDAISPVGAILRTGTTAEYLRTMGVADRDFGTYAERRGDHEVMSRGAFASAHLRNALVDRPGPWTKHAGGAVMPVYEAATRYHREETLLVIVAGKNYGAGSARDWAAKATAFLGVRAVIAASFERIHRENLVRMGVLPLTIDAADWHSLEVEYDDAIDVLGLEPSASVHMPVKVRVRKASGLEHSIDAIIAIETAEEATYYGRGGILPSVLLDLMRESVQA